MSKKNYHANGKLLITGEYFVLDGALALAVPTQLGQTLSIEKNNSNNIHWRSLDHQKQEWFSAEISFKDFTFHNTTDTATAERLQQILRAIRQQNPTFIADNQGVNLTTTLEFPRNWGLGSSSTLLYLLAEWAKVDVYQLLENTFGGSGYDLACAGNDQPIFYQKKEGRPNVSVIDFNPPFSEQLYFVFLEKKQNSRSGIQLYREKVKEDRSLIHTISEISRQVAATNDFADFCTLLLQHEQLVAQTIGLPRAQTLYFSDFQGIIKSLGAWGGDFVLAASQMSATETKAYFKQKGFSTVITYQDMVK